MKLDEILFAERGEQRIGQFIWNALAKARKWKAPEANALFFISDDDLEADLRDFLRTQKAEDMPY
jgi:hypothetical protein